MQHAAARSIRALRVCAVSAGAETLHVGRENTHGSLQLIPGGKLSGESVLGGMDVDVSGAWYIERDTMKLSIPAAGTINAILNRDGQLRFALPMLESTRKKAYEVAMKSDLRNLVSAQEAFFADMARYSGSLQELYFKPSTGVSAHKITLGNGSYSAIVTHTQLPGAQCAIAVNRSNPLEADAAEGEPACIVPAPRDTLFFHYLWQRVK